MTGCTEQIPEFFTSLLFLPVLLHLLGAVYLPVDTISVLDTLRVSSLSLHNHAVRWHFYASFMDNETKVNCSSLV